MARIGGGMILICSLLIVLEVFLRKLANYSIHGIDEYAGYALSISVAISLPYTLLKRAHIRVDAFYNILSNRLSSILDWLAIFSLAGFSIFLAYSSYDVFSSSLRFEATSNTPLSTPLWMPQLLWFIGFLVFMVSCLIVFVLCTKYLLKGELEKIKSCVGGKSIDEELAEEIENKNNL